MQRVTIEGMILFSSSKRCSKSTPNRPKHEYQNDYATNATGKRNLLSLVTEASANAGELPFV